MGLRVRGALLGVVMACTSARVAADVPPASAQPRQIEFTPVPLIGGDSDIGLGGGALISLASVSQIHRPYLWRLEAFAMTTFKPSESGLTTPYQDYYVHLIVPHVLRDRLEIQARVSYTKMRLKYFGVGNATLFPEDAGDRYYTFERTHPTLRARALYRLSRLLEVEMSLAYTHNWVDVPSPSKLRDDAASGSDTVRRLLDGFGDHGVFTASYGIWFDTRDDKISPSSGQLHSIRLDVSPGGSQPLQYAWTRTALAARGFVRVLPRVVLAARLVLDAISGEPPFYELARFDDTFALGGAKGVRGVPGQRYQGKLKVFGNLEARLEILDFEFLGKTNSLGATLFFDTGRLWADYSSNPDLDGSALGLKYGLGSGLRLLAGRSFVIRGDVAFSPDARPLGAYFVAGHMF